MKITVRKPVELDVKFLRVTVPVRYEEDDIPNDFPLRNNDIWRATIDLDTGDVLNWPKGEGRIFGMKVCDAGQYELLNAESKVIAERFDYVPYGCGIGGGDYIEMGILPTGKVGRWPAQPELDVAFFGED
jgi:hypothetical protein